MAKLQGMYWTAYVEMSCIGDYADFVVYTQDHDVFKRKNNESSWMVPGSWNDRDEFGRKTRN